MAESKNALAFFEKINSPRNLGRAKNLLGAIEINRGNGEKACEWLTAAVAHFEKEGSPNDLAIAFYNLGRAQTTLGREAAALANFQKAVPQAARAGAARTAVAVAGGIGILYEQLQEFEKAEKWYREGLVFAEKTGKALFVGEGHENLGILFSKQKRWAEAETELRKAVEIFEKEGYERGLAYAFSQLGNARSQQNDRAEGEKWLLRALPLCQKIGDQTATLSAATMLGEAQSGLGKMVEARQSFELAETFFEKGIDKNVLIESMANSSDFWAKAGDPGRAFRLRRDRDVLRDSLFSEEKNRLTAEMQARFEVAAKDRELAAQAEKITAQRQTQWALGGILALAVGLAWAFRSGLRRKARHNRLLRAEQKRSDELLLNILPADVAEELKHKKASPARRFEEVTVICSDFCAFTGMAERLAPEELVALIDEYFRGFDQIMADFEIEKIKTVGDAYIGACGLAGSSHDADRAIEAARAMRDFVEARKAAKTAAGQPFFECRFGLSTGPVVAGIVGAKKFAYDIWGDTVNVAVRMEQCSGPGQVNVSEATFSRAKKARFEPPRTIEVKGKGLLAMRFLAFDEHATR